MSSLFSCSSEGSEELTADLPGQLTRRNEQTCPIDNDQPFSEAEGVGGRSFGGSQRSGVTETSGREDQQQRFPIQEQLPPEASAAHRLHQVPPAFPDVRESGTSLPGAWPRHLEQEYQLPFYPEVGNEASGCSGLVEEMGRGSIQRTALRGLLLSSQEEEGGRVRGRSNFPVEEEGQEAEQEYCRGEFPNRANPIKQKDQVTEHFCHTWELQLPKVALNRLPTFEAIMRQIEGIICRGTYHWKIRNFQQCRRDAISGAVVAQFSHPICTNLYGYKLCMGIHLNGVNTGIGSHVALFVHMMQGEYDDRLRWPFTGVITLSILDQSCSEMPPNDISKALVASPNLLAFGKPTAICGSIGCGFEKFAPIFEVSGPRSRFIKNDTLVVKIEISV